MEIAEHIAIVGREAELFAEAARRTELEANIDGGPGWTMRDLVRHLSEIHLWAAGVISQHATKLFPGDISEHTETWPGLAIFWPDDGDLIDWYLETNANLVRCLEAALPSDETPYFLKAPSPLAMWARRQAHEIAMHRWDAENASGTTSGFDPVFAADGIDETVDAYATRADEFPTTSIWTMVVHARDTGDRWHLSDGPADVTLTGNASDLHLALWNRTDDSTIDVAGEHNLLDV